MPRRKAHTDEHDTAEGGDQAHAQELNEAGEHSASSDSRPNGRENGVGAIPAQSGTEATQAPASPTMHRAEEMVDHLAERIGHYAGVVGQKILWLFARAREEAEDIYAEAQALRRGEHVETPPSQQQ